MNLFLEILFVFYLGCTLGWCLEFCYRGIGEKHIVNPGLLVGPYLPIYGFGLTLLTIIYIVCQNIVTSPILVILLMGLGMTIIELIGGLIFVNGKGLKLWDYSDEWLNYKGVICPKYTFYWTLLCVVFYYVLANPIVNAMHAIDDNLIATFLLGIFLGIIIVDAIYSTKLYIKISKFMKENNISARFEELKDHVKEEAAKRKEKYNFLFSFKQSTPLQELLEDYRAKQKKSFLDKLLVKTKLKKEK